MVRSKNTANILIRSILKSGSTQSLPSPAHDSSPPPPAVPTPQLSYSLPAMPPQPSSHSPSPPAPATQCTVRYESNPALCSKHGRSDPLGSGQREGKHSRKCQVVSFSPILTLYSVGGHIQFLKHFKSTPGYQVFRHLETSPPFRRRTWRNTTPSSATPSQPRSLNTYSLGLLLNPEKPQPPSSSLHSITITMGDWYEGWLV